MPPSITEMLTYTGTWKWTPLTRPLENLLRVMNRDFFNLHQAHIEVIQSSRQYKAEDSK